MGPDLKVNHAACGTNTASHLFLSAAAAATADAIFIFISAPFNHHDADGSEVGVRTCCRSKPTPSNIHSSPPPRRLHIDSSLVRVATYVNVAGLGAKVKPTEDGPLNRFQDQQPTCSLRPSRHLEYRSHGSTGVGPSPSSTANLEQVSRSLSVAR